MVVSPSEPSVSFPGRYTFGALSVIPCLTRVPALACLPSQQTDEFKNRGSLSFVFR